VHNGLGYSEISVVFNFSSMGAACLVDTIHLDFKILIMFCKEDSLWMSSSLSFSPSLCYVLLFILAPAFKRCHYMCLSEQFACIQFRNTLVLCSEGLGGCSLWNTETYGYLPSGSAWICMSLALFVDMLSHHVNRGIFYCVRQL